MKDVIVAVNSNCYHGFTIDEAIDGIYAAGFKYIELTATKGWTEHVFTDLKFDELLRIKEKLKRLDIKPISMSGHCNLMDKERLDDFKENIHLAKFFDCKYIVSSIGEAHLNDVEVVKDTILLDHLRTLVKLLKEFSMTLVLEVHGDHGSGKAINKIIKDLNEDCVKIAYDSANAIFYGGVDIIDDMKSCIENISYIHIKDKAGKQKEWNFPYLGSGDIDFKKVFELLKTYKNNSPLSIEIEFTEKGPESLEEVNNAVLESKKFLERNGYKVGGEKN
ncbi:MAG: sugar phosphate isomerase/epimerase family protein [Anaerorhabdus sp.]